LLGDEYKMTNNTYIRPMESVLEYIEKHIDSDLSLETLSTVAGFSPYHFHRIFHALIGKTLHQYVLEQKLNYCAKQLLYENCDITRIALDYGFGTPSSFAKNFKRQFGCTPTQYKETKARKYPIAFAKISFQNFSFDVEIENSFSKVNLPDLQTICIGITGLSETWEKPEIEKAYLQIFNWLKVNNKTISTTKICGITLDTPEVQALSSCRYYACATVDSFVNDDYLTFRSFQTSGEYICCRIDRDKKDFTLDFFKYMDYLYGFYMFYHKLLPDCRPFVEFYEKGSDGKTYINFCVPVKNSKK
jgi:AraC family transcriptional regulator